MRVARTCAAVAAVLALHLTATYSQGEAWALTAASLAGGTIWVIALDIWRARQRKRRNAVSFRMLAAGGFTVPDAWRRSGVTAGEATRAILSTMRAPCSEGAMCEFARLAHRGVIWAWTKLTEWHPAQVTLYVHARWWARLPVMRRRVLRAVEQAIESQTPAGVQVRVVLTGKGRRRNRLVSVGYRANVDDDERVRDMRVTSITEVNED